VLFVAITYAFTSPFSVPSVLFVAIT